MNVKQRYRVKQRVIRFARDEDKLLLQSARKTKQTISEFVRAAVLEKAMSLVVEAKQGSP